MTHNSIYAQRFGKYPNSYIIYELLNSNIKIFFLTSIELFINSSKNYYIISYQFTNCNQIPNQEIINIYYN